MDNENASPKITGKEFIRKQWKVLSTFATVIVAGIIGAFLVFLWFVDSAQTTGFVPSMIGAWTIGYTVSFVLTLIFWELILVGSWVLVLCGIIFYRWYKSVPEEERDGWPKGSKRDGGGAFGFLIMLTWLVITYIEGRWDTAFQLWTLNDWIFTWLSALFWDLLIFGIPMLLYFIWWIKND